MKNYARGAIAFIVLIFITTFVYAYHNDVTTFEVDINGALVMSVIVPDLIYLGNITEGKEGARSERIYVNNTGSVNVTITPQLVSSNPVFSYLYFMRRAADTPKRIGEFSFDLNASGVFGKSTRDYIYTILDLRNYEGHLPYDVYGYKADVKFFVAAQQP